MDAYELICMQTSAYETDTGWLAGLLLCFGLPVIILPTCSMNPETAVTIN